MYNYNYKQSKIRKDYNVQKGWLYSACIIPVHVVLLERRRLTARPSARVLPTGSRTLRTVVLASSFTTEPRGICTREKCYTYFEIPYRSAELTELKSATSPSHGARPSAQLLGVLQSVFGFQ